MGLRQMQVAVDHVQDRLLVRFSVNEADEYRVHITRRLLRDLWPLLMTAVGHGRNEEAPALEKPAETPPPQDFSQTFDNPEPIFPLGPTPLLIGECAVQINSAGLFVLSLREPRERRFDLTVDREALHMLCSMLKAAAQTARWELTLEFATPDTATALPALPQEALPAPPGNKLLH